MTSRHVTLRGLRFHYQDWGGEARPVVLLHGLASNCHIWDLVAPLLSACFRPLALDQRGHGQTHGPEDGYHFDSVAEDLEAFTQALGLDRPVLVGHSWGGNVALHYAVAYPHKVSALVLVDGGTIEVSSMPGMTWEQAQQRLSPPDFSEMTVDSLLERVKGGDLGEIWSAKVEEIFLSNFHISPSGKVEPRLKRPHHVLLVRALWEHKPSLLFSKVACPTLIVPARRPPRTDRDYLFSESKKRMVSLAQDLLPNCHVLWMDDTIHDIPLQRPKELAEAITQFASKAIP